MFQKPEILGNSSSSHDVNSLTDIIPDRGLEVIDRAFENPKANETLVYARLNAILLFVLDKVKTNLPLGRGR